MDLVTLQSVQSLEIPCRLDLVLVTCLQLKKDNYWNMAIYLIGRVPFNTNQRCLSLKLVQSLSSASFFFKSCQLANCVLGKSTFRLY